MRATLSRTLIAAALLAGCNDDPDTTIEDLTDVPSFAVQRSDYESAAVALLDGDGALIADEYISSGKTPPGLNSALHGDITLPTTPCKADALMVIARFGGDYVFEMNLDENEVMHQVATQNSDLSDTAAYRSNPQDALCLGGDEVLVTRFAANPAPGDDELDKGDDIVVIDLEAEEITDRIDLSEAQVMVEGSSMGETVEELAYARPGAIVRLGDYAVVGLGRLSDSYIAAEGMVAVIDLDRRALSSLFALDGMANCNDVTKVAGRDDAVIVSCAGSPFGNAENAGVVLLELDGDGELSEAHALREQEAPALFTSIVSLGGTRAIAATLGDYTEMTDAEVFVVDLDTGEREKLFTGEGPGSVGTGSYREDTGLLLIPDAAKGVRLFDVTDDAVDERDVIELDPALPARSVRAIRP